MRSRAGKHVEAAPARARDFAPHKRALRRSALEADAASRHAVDADRGGGGGGIAENIDSKRKRLLAANETCGHEAEARNVRVGALKMAPCFPLLAEPESKIKSPWDKYL